MASGRNYSGPVSSYYSIAPFRILVSLLAKKYGTTVNDLVRLNNIKNANLIYPGQVLKLPSTTTNVVSQPALSKASVESTTLKVETISESSKESVSSNNNKEDNVASETSVTNTPSSTLAASKSENSNMLVWISDDGKKYHSKSSCSGMKNNVRQVHGQGGKDQADVKEQKRIDKHLNQRRDRQRQQGDEKAQTDLTGKQPAPPDSSHVIEQHDRDCRQQHKRIPGSPVALSFRCDEEKSVVNETAYDQ